VFLLTENIRNQKSNLGSWSYCKSFEGIPADSYGRGKRMATDAFNKVNGTQNIYAVGDTCIQLTDEKNLSRSSAGSSSGYSARLNLASNFKRILKTKQ
jgi:NADH dehydrogenase